MDRSGFGFPFDIDPLGQVAVDKGDAKLRSKIYQVLLTAPGERVQLPEFGCSLRDLVFDPGNDILAATTEFSVRRALVRWLGDEIIIEDVSTEQVDERLQVDVVYVRRDRLERSQVKIVF
jgi:phage baseplate assembly protein W